MGLGRLEKLTRESRAATRAEIRAQLNKKGVQAREKDMGDEDGEGVINQRVQQKGGVSRRKPFSREIEEQINGNKAGKNPTQRDIAAKEAGHKQNLEQQQRRRKHNNAHPVSKKLVR